MYRLPSPLHLAMSTARISSFILAALLLGSSAYAQSSEADKHNASALTLEGQRLLKVGDARAALAKFQAAHEVLRAPTTGLDVAMAYEALGELVEARAMVHEVSQLPAQPNEPFAYKQARATAASAIEALDSRIPSLVLRIEGAPKEAVTATIDNDKVPPESLTAPYPRNPGKREVVVTAPGYKTARATVELVEGESKPVEVVLVLVREAAPLKAPPLPQQHEPAPTRSSALIYLGAGITGTLAVVGVGTMIGVKALYGPAEDKLAGKCDRDCASEFDSLTSIQKALAYTSFFTFIGAGIVGGATLAYGATGKNSDEAEKGPHGAIVVTPGGGSFVVTGRW
jgi:hypothetical protein